MTAMPWKPLPTPDAGLAEPVPVGRSLDRLTTSFGGPRATALTAVFARWDDLVGATIAAHVRPLSLAGGTLVVTVDEPGWATQIRYMEADLVQRIGEVAAGAVSRVEVRVRTPR